MGNGGVSGGLANTQQLYVTPERYAAHAQSMMNVAENPAVGTSEKRTICDQIPSFDLRLNTTSRFRSCVCELEISDPMSSSICGQRMLGCAVFRSRRKNPTRKPQSRLLRVTCRTRPRVVRRRLSECLRRAVSHRDAYLSIDGVHCAARTTASSAIAHIIYSVPDEYAFCWRTSDVIQMVHCLPPKNDPTYAGRPP